MAKAADNIDFSSLRKRIHIYKVLKNYKINNYKIADYFRALDANYIVAIICGLIILGMLLMVAWLIFPDLDLENNTNLVFIVYMVNIIIIVLMTVLISIFQKEKTDDILQFCAINGFKYQPTSYGIGNSSVFRNTQGSTTEVNNKISGKFNNLQFWFGNINYILPVPHTDQQTETRVGVINIMLENNLPNILLDSKSNNLLGLSELPNFYHPDNKFELEGDFNKYFSVMVPKGYITDMLYILTPELMQDLIIYVPDFDIEIIDNNLKLYSKKNIKYKQKDLHTIFNIIDKIGTEFIQNTKNYKDVKSDSTNKIIAPSGQRLL